MTFEVKMKAESKNRNHRIELRYVPGVSAPYCIELYSMGIDKRRFPGRGLTHKLLNRSDDYGIARERFFEEVRRWNHGYKARLWVVE